MCHCYSDTYIIKAIKSICKQKMKLVFLSYWKYQFEKRNFTLYVDDKNSGWKGEDWEERVNSKVSEEAMAEAWLLYECKYKLLKNKMFNNYSVVLHYKRVWLE